MIAESRPTEDTQRFVVRPNASLTKGGAQLFFICISLLSLGIAIRFFVLGAWMILPIAILELSLLGACLHFVLKQNERVEAIDFDQSQVRWKQYFAGIEKSHAFNRHWVQVIREKSAFTHHPSRLFLRSHGKSVEIASFVDEEERKSLEQRLRSALALG